MISQSTFDAYFDAILEILPCRVAFTPADRATYHAIITGQLSEEEWAAAAAAVINTDTEFPVPDRIIQLGQAIRPTGRNTPIADRGNYPLTPFQRMNPEQQKDYLEAIARARAIVLESAARVTRKKQPADAMDWLEF